MLQAEQIDTSLRCWAAVASADWLRGDPGGTPGHLGSVDFVVGTYGHLDSGDLVSGTHGYLDNGVELGRAGPFFADAFIAFA